jgi:hypothetical protein
VLLVSVSRAKLIASATVTGSLVGWTSIISDATLSPCYQSLSNAPRRANDRILHFHLGPCSARSFSVAKWHIS